MKQFVLNSFHLPKIVAKNSEHSALFERNEPRRAEACTQGKMLTCFTQNFKAPDERSHKCQECHY